MNLAAFGSASIAALSLFAGAAQAAQTIVYAPPAAWVKPALKGEKPELDAQAASYARLSEEDQTRFTRAGVDHHHAHRIQALTGEGLGLVGSVRQTWDPATETLTIHRLRIERDGQVIDVLANDRFEILRRETSLEDDMLDGRLTAALQIADLRVGDIVDYAFTTSYSPTLLAGRNASQDGFVEDTVGAARIRAIWDKDATVRWKAGEGLPKPVITETATGGELLIEKTQAVGYATPTDAPARYIAKGMVQYSQLARWDDASRLFFPLFDKAATLSPTSPLKAEAARIRQAASTPEAQAGLALKLVQERVRYVAITMNAQGYTPAAADETWRRRFGDCKGKTAMLLALLRELGIEAQAALVSSEDGDMLSELLPQATAFDHVIVRARIGGQTYWLDGTRPGDGPIDTIPTPDFVWALPLTAHGAALERIEIRPLVRPHFETLARIDASAGFDKPAKIEAVIYARGDDALQMARFLPGEPRAKAQEALFKAYADRWDWAEFKTAGWKWSEAEGLMTVTLQGEGKLRVETVDGVPHVDFQGSNRLGLAPELRPAKEDQAAPYKQPFPAYFRYVEVMKLPVGGRNIDVFGDPIDETIGGVRQTRMVRKVGSYAVMTHSIRRLSGELSADDAGQAVKADKAAEDSHAGLWPALKAQKPKPLPRLASLDGRAAWDRALDADSAGDDAAAEVAYAMAAAKGIKDPTLSLQRAASLLRLKRYPEVLTLVDSETGPLKEDELIQAQWLRATALVELKRGDEALAYLDREVDSRPTAWTHVMRARVHQTRGDAAAAIKDLNRATTIGSDNLYVVNEMTDAWLDLERWDEMVATAKHSLSLDPEAFESWSRLAYAQDKAGRKAEALASYEEILRFEPLDTQVMVERAVLLAALARRDEATAQLDAAVLQEPDSPEVLNSTCWSRATLSLQVEKGLAECEHGLKVSPRNGVLLDSRGFAKLRLGRASEALADYEAAVKLKPDQVDSLYGRGLARIRTGAVAAGQADLAAAEKAEPGISKRWEGYGMTP